MHFLEIPNPAREHAGRGPVPLQKRCFPGPGSGRNPPHCMEEREKRRMRSGPVLARRKLGLSKRRDQRIRSSSRSPASICLRGSGSAGLSRFSDFLCCGVGLIRREPSQKVTSKFRRRPPCPRLITAQVGTTQQKGLRVDSMAGWGGNFPRRFSLARPPHVKQQIVDPRHAKKSMKSYGFVST